MKEIGVDISSHRSKSIDEFKEQSLDYVITVWDNAKESCPFFPANSKLIHWSFDDPAEAVGNEEQQLSVFRRVRNEIKQKLQDFILSVNAVSPSF